MLRRTRLTLSQNHFSGQCGPYGGSEFNRMTSQQIVVAGVESDFTELLAHVKALSVQGKIVTITARGILRSKCIGVGVTRTT